MKQFIHTDTSIAKGTVSWDDSDYSPGAVQILRLSDCTIEGTLEIAVCGIATIRLEGACKVRPKGEPSC